MKDSVGSRGWLNELSRKLQQGVHDLSLLDTPHLVLLHRDFYETHLKKPLAHWALYFFVPWLIAEVSNAGDSTEPPHTAARRAAWDDLLWLAHGNSGDLRELVPVRANDGTPGAAAQKRIEDKLLAYVIGQDADGRRVTELTFGCPPGSSRDRAESLDKQTVKLINLARQWLTSLVPHVLSKRVKIEFGLLPRESWVNSAVSPKRSRAKTMGRKLLAVPYVGKDSPSEAAEVR